MPNILRMLGATCALGWAGFAMASEATDLSFSPDLSNWHEVAVPPEDSGLAYRLWYTAAQGSDTTWRVFIENGQPRARLFSEDATPERRPAFKATDKRFGGEPLVQQTDDGWLVAFNMWRDSGSRLYLADEGELIWYSKDGRDRHLVSKDVIGAFFTIDGVIYAVEGKHVSRNWHGSLLKLSRRGSKSKWSAQSLVKFPNKEPPTAAAVSRDGTIFVALHYSLIAIDRDLTVRTIFEEVAWPGLMPATSIVISPDHRSLYLGLRQYVAKVDIDTSKTTFLIPSKEFIHGLSDKETEEAREWQERDDEWDRVRKAAISVEVKSADLKQCPDGHTTLKDVPIMYGLPGGDWKELDRQIENFEISLGGCEFRADAPSVRPTCTTCRFSYGSVSKTWSRQSPERESFVRPFSDALRSFPLPPERRSQRYFQNLKDGHVEQEGVSFTMRRDSLPLKREIDEWFARRNLKAKYAQKKDPFDLTPKVGHFKTRVLRFWFWV